MAPPSATVGRIVAGWIYTASMMSCVAACVRARVRYAANDLPVPRPIARVRLCLPAAGRVELRTDQPVCLCLLHVVTGLEAFTLCVPGTAWQYSDAPDHREHRVEGGHGSANWCTLAHWRSPRLVLSLICFSRTHGPA